MRSPARWKKAGLRESELDLIFAGDLLNQCVGSSFALRESRIPFTGFTARAPQWVRASLAALMIDGGYALRAAALTSSHFCTAERQYRMPVPYGFAAHAHSAVDSHRQRLLYRCRKCRRSFITHVTTGRIIDKGITDANNMGAAMAAAAYDTLCALFRDTQTKPEDYDLIVTGDLESWGIGSFPISLRATGCRSARATPTAAAALRH